MKDKDSNYIGFWGTIAYSAFVFAVAFFLGWGVGKESGAKDHADGKVVVETHADGTRGVYEVKK